MIDNFAERLGRARRMAGLSLQQLADRPGVPVSRQAISKYETGKMKPDSTVLIALANALKVPPDYFFRPFAVRLPGFDFRKSSRLSRKSEDRIKEVTLDFVERYAELENLLNMEERYVNPLRGFQPVRSYADIEAAALALRKAWQLGEAPVSDLTELLETKGFMVIAIEADPAFDGLSAEVPELAGPLITINTLMGPVRRRLTLGHELAHILLRFSGEEAGSHERLCHAFAGALLLPASMMRSALGPKRHHIEIRELIAIKETYGASLQAIMKRAHHLEIVSDSAYRGFCIMVNRKGWRKDEPGRYAGRERCIRFDRLLYRAVAEDLVTMSRAAQLAGKPLASFKAEVTLAA